MPVDVKSYSNIDYDKIVINSDSPAVKFDESNSLTLTRNKNIFSDIFYDENEQCLVIKKSYDLKEKFIGLGEKAYKILKNRGIFTMYNTDPSGYERYRDPLYLSIPFLVSINDGNITGIFINSAAKIVFDIGITTYDKITIKIYKSSAEIFIFNATGLESLYEKYTKVTGKTFLPPVWALGHQISRYSYYPENRVIDVVKEYKKYIDVSAVYLDIDYMEDYKIFTFDHNRFPDPSKLLNELHSENTKLITIIDPGIKLDQNYSVFISGTGNYVDNKNNEIYTSKLWPGNCAMPDFFNENAIKWWKENIKNFIGKVDGIWLDMNEPALFNEFKTIDDHAVHNINNKKIEHKYLHNAYAYYQVKATFEAIKESGKDPFIVSRSGFAGIQQYAAIWTGDNISKEDDLTLQISMVTSLNLSGVSVCGCDIGGFMGKPSTELIAKYYKMALLFPFYRNHSDKYTIDREIFNLPSIVRDSIIKSVKIRYEFLDYMYSIIYESHIKGHPVIRPMFYYDINDSDSYYIDDQYMLGTLLYAPMIYNGKRSVYLPTGNWLDIINFVIYEGNKYYETDQEYPLYLKENSMVLFGNELIIYGESQLTLFKAQKEINISFTGNALKMSNPVNFDLVLYGSKFKHIIIDGNQTEPEIKDKLLKIKLNNALNVEFK